MKIMFLLLLFLTFNLEAKIYEGKFNFFQIKRHTFQEKLPAEVSSINFGFIGSYVKDNYIIRYKPGGGTIIKRQLAKIKTYKTHLNTNKTRLSQLKYNTILSREEKEDTKFIFLQNINYYSEQIKILKGSIKLYKTKTKFGLKIKNQYLVSIHVKRGDILIKGVVTHQTMDTSIARMKIQLSKKDYKSILFKSIRLNNVVIDNELVKKAPEEAKEKPYTIYIYNNTPSIYEIGKKYKITLF